MHRLQCDIPKTTAGNEWADLFRMFTAQMSRKGTRNKCASPVLFAHDLNKTTGAFERIQLTSALTRYLDEEFFARYSKARVVFELDLSVRVGKT